jgi:hypothetical protein
MFSPFFAGKEIKVYVAQMIETVSIEGRASTCASDLKTFEFARSGLNTKTLLLSFGNVGSTYQTRALFKED